MNDWRIEELKRLEKERDRNLAIHCEYVAAKFQRMIDRIKKEMEMENHEQWKKKYFKITYPTFVQVTKATIT